MRIVVKPWGYEMWVGRVQIGAGVGIDPADRYDIAPRNLTERKAARRGLYFVHA